MSRRALSLVLVGSAVALIFAAVLVVAAMLGTPEHHRRPTTGSLVVICDDGNIDVYGDRNADVITAEVDPECLAP